MTRPHHHRDDILVEAAGVRLGRQLKGTDSVSRVSAGWTLVQAHQTYSYESMSRNDGCKKISDVRPVGQTRKISLIRFRHAASAYRLRWPGLTRALAPGQICLLEPRQIWISCRGMMKIRVAIIVRCRLETQRGPRHLAARCPCLCSFHGCPPRRFCSSQIACSMGNPDSPHRDFRLPPLL